MQKLQLYIEGQRVDLFKDETVSLTQTLQNVKDIGKIFTEFTKTFAIPASRVNNKIFKHYYNFDVSVGDTTSAYDARNKQPATLELNDLPFKEGLIKLNGVKLKNNVAHTYNITFFGNTVNLKDILGSTQLSALQYPQTLNQIYSFGDVTTAMQTAQNSGDIIVPLITHTNRLIYDSGVHNVFDPEATFNNIAHQGAGQQQQNGVQWDQFKYAIKLQAIIDAIQAETFVGGQTLTFSDDFFNDASNDDFNNLYLWLHRKKGAVETASPLTQNFTQVTELGTTVCFPTNNCQPTISNVSGGILALTAQPPYSVSFLTLNLIPPNNTDQYTVRVIRNGSQIVGENSGTGNQQLTIQPWNDSTYTVQIASSTTMIFPIGGIKWSVTWTTPPPSTGFGSNGQMVYSNAATFTTTAFKEFNISEQMPKMTVIDFLTGLFKMFNLTAYVDGAGTIVVRTLDSYYASGSAIPINIDKYLDTTNSTVNVALPFKNIQFSYKGLGTLLAKRFEQENNLGWGTLSYSLDGDIFDAPTGSYKVELPFEHLQYQRLYDLQGNVATGVQWGYFVDDNEESYFGSPLIFYAIRQVNTTNIRIRDTDSTSVADIDDYFIPSNSLALESSTSKVNIHFGNEINEYQAFQSGVDSLAFTDTLFYTKYRTYIRNVFDVSRRITKVTAYLPMKIYYNLQLNDLIQLGQENYKINSLVTNLTTGKTEFELLNDVNPLVSGGTIPTIPTSLTVTNLTSTSVTFCWDASTSAVLMRSYQIFQDGTQQSNIVQRVPAIPISSTYCATVTGLTSGTNYTFYVSALNEDVEKSALSAPLNITTL
jgi:hypothetical protein